MKLPAETKPTLATLVVEPPASGQLPLIAADQLFRQGNTLRIEHAGQIYQLRVTRENKLILTK